MRKVTPTKSDKLSELIAACAITPEGTRSEADFAICCYAIRHGIAKAEVWPKVQSVGKFVDHGRRYFELTWESAEYDVRATLDDGTIAAFKKSVSRRYTTYQVFIESSEACHGNDADVQFEMSANVPSN